MDHQGLGWMKAASVFVGAVAGVITFTFTTFVTKDNLRDVVIDRMNRIELKIDSLIDKANSGHR